MAAFWNRRRGRATETGNQEPESSRQSIGHRRSLSHLLAPISSLNRSKSKDQRQETAFITCEERIHYPLYNPNDPRHNPAAKSQSLGSHGRATSSKSDATSGKGTSSEASRSKSLRRARSAFMSLTGTFKFKSNFSRGAIPVKPDDIPTDTGRRQLMGGIACGTTGFDAQDVRQSYPTDIPVPPPFTRSLETEPFTPSPTSQLPQSVKKLDSYSWRTDNISGPSIEGNTKSYSVTSDQTTRQIQTTTHTTVFPETIEQESIERGSSSFHYNDICESLAFLSANHSNKSFVSRKTCQVAINDYDNSHNQEATQNSSLSSQNPLTSECPTEAVNTSNQIDDISSSPERTLVSSSVAHNTSGSYVSNQGVEAQGSPSLFAHPSETEPVSQSGTNGLSLDNLKPNLPTKLGKFWLDCRKSSSAAPNPGVSDLSTESDSDFGFDLCRTRCLDDGNTSGADDDSLLMSWLESVDKFSVGDERSGPQTLPNHGSLPFRLTKLDPENPSPASPSRPSVPPTIRWKDSYVTGKFSELDSVSPCFGRPQSNKSIPYDGGCTKTGRENTPKPDTNDSPISFAQALSYPPDSSLCIEQGADITSSSLITQEDHDVDSKLHSIHPIQTQPNLPSHLRYLVEAIDRNSGMELADTPDTTEKQSRFLYPLKVPNLQTTDHKANLPVTAEKTSPIAISSSVNSHKRFSTIGCEREKAGSLSRKEGSSSGSNDSGPSEPVSSTTVATTFSSISCVYDSQLERSSKLPETEPLTHGSTAEQKQAKAA